MSILALSIWLGIMLVLAAFFSAAETGMMTINRYRLKHLARVKHHYAARRAKRLLEKPDQLLGVVLIGNTCANIFASALETTIALKLHGDFVVLICTALLTIFILIFCEVAPKTVAALYPEPVAFFVALPLRFFLFLLYPFVWCVNAIVNGFLKLFNITVGEHSHEPLTAEELRTVVYESATKIPVKHQNMLLGILDLNKVTVNDIMVPRSEIIGLDLSDDWETLLQQLSTSQHTRLPVYTKNLEAVHGLLHLRDALILLLQNKLNQESLMHLLQPLHFVPEGVLLNKQLLNFQREHYRTGLIIDEYGDILGLVTLEDILEEIVGEFTTDFASISKDIYSQPDDSFLVDGSIMVRKLNRVMGWHFETGGAHTLSGLIIEYLQMLPRAATCLRLDGYPIEIIQVKDNMIKTVKIFPQWRKLTIEKDYPKS